MAAVAASMSEWGTRGLPGAFYSLEILKKTSKSNY